MTLSIRLSDEMEQRLNSLAALTGRSKSYYVKQALAEKLEEMEDIYIAEQRLLDKNDKIWTLEQVINGDDLAN